MVAADLLKRPLEDRFFLYRALVLVNAYEFAKFSLPNSITIRRYGGGAISRSGGC